MWASIIYCSSRIGGHRDVLSPPAPEAQDMLHTAQPSVWDDSFKFCLSVAVETTFHSTKYCGNNHGTYKNEFLTLNCKHICTLKVYFQVVLESTKTEREERN